jgi:hypothetical protein
MRTFTSLVGKVGLTAGGVAIGLILAAGSGAAAVHISRVAATEHSITAQPVADDRGLSDRTGTDSASDLVDDRLVPQTAESAEPEPGDDSRSRATTVSAAGAPTEAARGNGTVDDGAHQTSVAAGQAGDDHGKDSGK